MRAPTLEKLPKLKLIAVAATGLEWRPGFDENIPHRTKFQPVKEFELQASLA